MNMKHKLLIVSVLSGSLFLLGGCGYNKNNSLVVFNYGDYLDPSIIDSFEKETGIKILYEEYQSPEEMYMKYKADIVDYDVICSSDYILEKLRTEDELLPINFDNIPNAANIRFLITGVHWAFFITHVWWMKRWIPGIFFLIQNTVARSSWKTVSGIPSFLR